MYQKDVHEHHTTKRRARLPALDVQILPFAFLCRFAVFQILIDVVFLFMEELCVSKGRA